MEPLTIDFRGDALPLLEQYTTIPCISPDYARDWETAGHLEAAVQLLAEFAASRAIAGLSVEIHRLKGRTPVLFCEVPSTSSSSDGTVLLYGHFDKQPPLGAWGEGLDPFVPVQRGNKLFGRGTADDGYSTFAALLALEAVERAGLPHSRVLLLIEGSEESGSPDLDAHMDALAERMGTIDLLICLDSGAHTYDRLWLTQSLRGNLTCTVKVQVLEQGVHSGEAGGVVPSSFRILRHLLDRVEDSATGEILLPELHAEVPELHRQRFHALAEELGDAVGEALPTVDGLVLHGDDAVDRMLAQAWSPTLAFTGIDGVPAVADGGNVLRASTTAKLSFRLPPSIDGAIAATAIKTALELDPPHGATVEVHIDAPVGRGWVCPEPEPWLTKALDAASLSSFGHLPAWLSEGGSIPFLAQLGIRFPEVTILATGVLGPHSHAHGPDESLDLDCAQHVTESVAHLLTAFAHRSL